ncbi:hypothetical protein mRhiFer1_008349 [Rhinolophus ferrumequinum]|uniref:Uncharacterized protein n=1 Tax=Rhinolophus ferrumequinum TaxID=59479 RepID=A0A7J7VEH6_RHIFE|nr:hypothetical protein mRhiFer1_008349 [Rhinolophus ferrumequinum]
MCTAMKYHLRLDLRTAGYVNAIASLQGNRHHSQQVNPNQPLKKKEIKVRRPYTKLMRVKVELAYARGPCAYYAFRQKVSSVWWCCLAPWLLPNSQSCDLEKYLLFKSSQLLAASALYKSEMCCT